jgi:hypothetical protein
MLDKLNFELENFQLDTLPKQEDKELNTNWQELDLFELIETQRLLYSTRSSDYQPSASELED